MSTKQQVQKSIKKEMNQNIKLRYKKSKERKYMFLFFKVSVP